MTDLSRGVLGLLFTRKISLAFWQRVGMFDRELRPYLEHAKHFKEVILFTYGTADDFHYQKDMPSNMTIICRPRWIPITLYSSLMPLVHRGVFRRVDILKTNQMDGSWAGVLAKKLYGIKLVVRCGYEWLQFIERSGHGRTKRMFAAWAERLAYSAADIIVQTSNEAGQFVHERFRISNEKIKIIPNYIDTGRFAPLSAPEKREGIVFVGRLEPQKNLAALIEALEGLQVTLTVIGEGSERAVLEDLAFRKNVPVVWKGTIPQRALPEEFAKHELFVLPSLYEGSPKTLLEAMSCGLACVATDVVGSREVIRHRENGLLSDTDALSIREMVRNLLNDEPLRRTLGEHARNAILGKYSFEKIFEQELSVYTALT